MSIKRTYDGLIENRTLLAFINVFHLISAIIFVAGFAVGLFLFIQGSALNTRTLVVVIALTFVIALLCFITLSIAEKRRKSRLTDWNPGLWIESRETHAHIIDKFNAKYTYKIEAIIVRDDTSRLNWRVGWTGSGQLNVLLGNKKFKHDLAPAPADAAHILIVHFDRPYKKKEKVIVEFTLECNASERAAEPFYSMTFFESRLPNSARLCVNFGETMSIDSVQKEVYASDIAPWPMTPPEPVTLDANRLVDWSIEPIKDRRYGVRWEYEV